MNKQSLGKKVVRTTTILALGGSLFQAGGCDPAVKDTVLAGLQQTTTNLSTVLITAFFQSLADGEGDGGGEDLTTTGG